MFAIIKLRIKFTKTGNAKYISHLDLNRYMQRLIKRGKIPAVMTQGYNLHPVMSFALPLSLGVESICEYMDIKVLEDISCDDVERNMKLLSTPEISIEKVLIAKNHYNDIGFAYYTVVIGCNNTLDIECIFDYINNLPDIEIKKKDKKTKEFIVKNISKEVEFNNINKSVNEINFELELPAGTVHNINVNLVINAIVEKCEVNPIIIKITRTKIVCKDNTEFE